MSKGTLKLLFTDAEAIKKKPQIATMEKSQAEKCNIRPY